VFGSYKIYLEKRPIKEGKKIETKENRKKEKRRGQEGLGNK
jgi:hypothetical protein